MTGMLKDHPDLSPDWQDTILLAVSRAAIEFAKWMDGREVYVRVGREWDGYVDAGRVREESFGVVVEVVAGLKGEVVLGEEVGVVVGREFKRMFVEREEEDGEGEGHRAKRMRAE
jgi:hypothetical protein